MRKAKKRNPQDTTLRNTRAANKRIEQLEREVGWIRGELDAISRVLRQKADVAKDFATAQRSLGYQSSTAPKQSIRVKG